MLLVDACSLALPKGTRIPKIEVEIKKMEQPTGYAPLNREHSSAKKKL